jgi:hypothetical protein
MKRLSPSMEQRHHQLLRLEDMGDHKLSQFLRHLRRLAPDVPDSFLRSLWTSRLPSAVQATLIRLPETSLDSMAELADRLVHTIPSPTLHLNSTTHRRSGSWDRRSNSGDRRLRFRRQPSGSRYCIPAPPTVALLPASPTGVAPLRAPAGIITDSALWCTIMLFPALSIGRKTEAAAAYLSPIAPHVTGSSLTRVPISAFSPTNWHRTSGPVSPTASARLTALPSILMAGCRSASIWDCSEISRGVLLSPTSPDPCAAFLSHFGLLVDCKRHRLLDETTSFRAPAQPVTVKIASVKVVCSGTSVDSLLSEFPELLRPAGVQRAIHHSTAHHIRTTPGPPVSCRPPSTGA